jgi:hypothetical protein
MIFEYIVLIYNEINERTERKYGVVSGKDTKEAMTNLGKWYGDEIIRIEYFGTPAEDEEDTVYEFNDCYADRFDLTGRKFGKIIPPLNEIPNSGKIYE